MIEIIEGIKKEFNNNINGKDNILNKNLSNLNTVKNIKTDISLKFNLSGDSVLLNQNDRIKLYSQFVEQEILNLIHQLCITCMVSVDVEIEPVLDNIDIYEGCLFDKENNNINYLSYKGDINYGIKLVKGFVDIQQSIETLTIEQKENFIEFNIKLYLTENFNLVKISK